MYTHEHEVYFDNKRLVPGYEYDERLAEAICRSACMVIVYWPSYLESDYCKKEMAAMLDLEKKRRQLLGDELHGCRLLIPVILRGRFEELPEEVTKGCQYLDYKAQATKPDFNMGEDDKTSEELFRIAEYIKSLCDKMKNASDELFAECHQYAFPALPAPAAQDAIQPAPPQPFPGR
jgi:TIR domain